MTKNIAAFLAMIAHAEGTDRPPAPADAYRCCYAFSHVIQDLSEHPAITGEWIGESISSLGSEYTGQISSAAGKYQITRKTWIGCRDILLLPDFGPESQDDAAILLIKQRGGLSFVNSGDVQSAVQLVSPVWASMPYSNANQPKKPLASLIQVYTGAGGSLVAKV